MTIAQQLKIKEFPFEIKDSNSNQIYFENSDGYWFKRKYDSDGNQIYYEDSDGYWAKHEYVVDSDGKNNLAMEGEIMTKELQRIRIAEACGFGKSHWLELKDGIVFGTSGSLPDYLNDLNAMHEAEKFLNDMDEITYLAKLHNGNRYCSWEGTCATAAQRAEAFLKTLNLWIE
jgi:hypothetical protein